MPRNQWVKVGLRRKADGSLSDQTAVKYSMVTY